MVAATTSWLPESWQNSFPRLPSADVRALLDTAYSGFHSTFYRDRDPICLVHPYPAARDREIAGFFTAVLSYGNVTTIINSARRALAPLGVGRLRDRRLLAAVQGKSAREPRARRRSDVRSEGRIGQSALDSPT